MHSKKFENILHLSAAKRYDYFIRKVTDFEEVWSINHEQATLKGQKEIRIVPFFPERQFAEHYARKYSQLIEVKVISIDEFIEQLLPALKEKQLAISIFPIDETHEMIDIDTLKQNLETELQQYL